MCEKCRSSNFQSEGIGGRGGCKKFEDWVEGGLKKKINNMTRKLYISWEPLIENFCHGHAFGGFWSLRGRGRGLSESVKKMLHDMKYCQKVIKNDICCM